jgi:hypothetical protein
VTYEGVRARESPQAQNVSTSRAASLPNPCSGGGSPSELINVQRLQNCEDVRLGGLGEVRKV